MKEVTDFMLLFYKVSTEAKSTWRAHFLKIRMRLKFKLSTQWVDWRGENLQNRFNKLDLVVVCG